MSKTWLAISVFLLSSLVSVVCGASPSCDQAEKVVSTYKECDHNVPHVAGVADHDCGNDGDLERTLKLCG